MTEQHLYLIGLGSNLGNRRHYSDEAVRLISQDVGRIVARAPVYQTEPVGAADQPFLNSALLVESAGEPPPVLALLLAAEQALGRVRRERWGNRTIDLDLLAWRRADDPAELPSRRWASPELTLPHPRLLERDFALVPAAQIAGGWRHPESSATLAEECAARGYALTALITR